MSEGVLQPDGTICRKGAACTRHGKKSAPAISAATAVGAQLAEAKALASAPKPVVVERLKFSDPSYQQDVTSVVEYTYESYGCDGCYGCDTGEDYCRGASYEGLSIEFVEPTMVMARLLSCDEKDIDQETSFFANSIGLDEKYNYEINGVFNYYGESVEIEVGQDQMELIKKWYFDHDNARDGWGVLDYCRSKGTPTKGLTPLEAIKLQLTAENGGRTVDGVETANEISVVEAAISQIHKPQVKHFTESAPRAPRSLTGSDDVFLGVVVKKHAKLTLLDGYHRMKYAEENNITTGKFIVLEQR